MLFQMKFKIMLLVFIIEVQKPWSGGKVSGVPGKEIGDISHQVKYEDEGFCDNSAAVEPGQPAVNEPKILDGPAQQKNGRNGDPSHSNPHLHNALWNISSIKYNFQTSKYKTSLNFRLTEELYNLYHGKNSYKSGNSINTLHDDVLQFDLRSREDAYVISTPEKSPYSVFLLSRKFGSSAIGTCTGSIISKDWVLSAAHCVAEFDLVYVYAGGNSLKEISFSNISPTMPETAQFVKTKGIFIHPEYSSETHDGDVALASVELNLTKYVNVIPLTRVPWEDSYHTYTDCVFTGYGVVQVGEGRVDDYKRKTQRIKVKSPCICSFRLRMMFGDHVAGEFLCMEPREDYGVCPGDSGGGLVCGGVLRGVALLVTAVEDLNLCQIIPIWPSVQEIRCGGKNTISVFQDICPYLPWIQETTKVFNSSKDFSKECKHVNTTPSLVRGSEMLLILSFLAFNYLSRITE